MLKTEVADLQMGDEPIETRFSKLEKNKDKLKDFETMKTGEVT